MRCLIIFALTIFAAQQCVAPPVTKNKEEEKDEEHAGEKDQKDMENAIEYHRYLDEVVQALESDPEFRKKLEKAEEVDIRSGKIAHELDFVNYHVRTELDELKRTELERLRHLATQRYKRENDLDTDAHLKMAEHVDHTNPHTFEVNDLKKLIAKTTEDLAKADRKRRVEFKEYEMQKKFEQQEKMKTMNEEEKKKYVEELKALEEKHKKHKPLHHPGSEQQLKEVWDEQDHMNSQDFDPRTFFYLHDVDGNKVWDQDEVKALFLKELDKLYAEGVPEDDLRERQEEMERMREHVFKEADVNNDGLISYNEFLEQTKKPEFRKDEGWKSLDEQQIYSQQEYEEFERRQQEQIQRLIAQGILPPNQASYDPGHPQQFPPQYGHASIDQQHVGQMPLPAKFPDHLQGQLPPQQHFQGQAPPQHLPQQQQQFQGQQQVPQYQGQPPQHYEQQQFQGHQQVPQYQGQHQVPQYQAHPVQGQLSAQQGQVPVEHGQVPVQQGHAPLQHGQVPVLQGQVPVQHGQVPVQHGQVPVQHGQVPVHQGQVPDQHAREPVQQEQVQHPVDQAQDQQHHQTSGQQQQQQNAQGQAQEQQQNAQAHNNQAQQQAAQNQVPVTGNSAQAAPSPNLVKT